MLKYVNAVDNSGNAPIFDPSTTKHTHAMNTERIAKALANNIAKQSRRGAWMISVDRAVRLGLPEQQALDIRNAHAKSVSCGKFSNPFRLGA